MAPEHEKSWSDSHWSDSRWPQQDWQQQDNDSHWTDDIGGKSWSDSHWTDDTGLHALEAKLDALQRSFTEHCESSQSNFDQTDQAEYKVFMRLEWLEKQ